MKALNLFLAVLFTCTVCLFAASGEAPAAVEKKQPNVAADTEGAQNVAPIAEKKVRTSAKKEIPADVDVNAADKALLTALPGIGPKTADAIIAYRQENGNFKSLDELTRVKGIGDKTLAKLRPYLRQI